ncbi:protein of unknown function [Shinella sp. WSC3-e]|nr:protein of unknown function [Shinella sp. WSC3-e]
MSQLRDLSAQGLTLVRLKIQHILSDRSFSIG